jgi:tetratricopeptide (TPR) repeat protein
MSIYYNTGFLMSNTEKCPICNSNAINKIYEHNQAFCKNCHHSWKIEAPSSSEVPLSNELSPDKLIEYIRRIFLVLMAAEQAELKDFELLTGKSKTEYHGLELDVLSSWLGETDSKHLILILHTLKEMLRIEKGQTYKFALTGLPSDLQESLRDELIEEHRQLARNFHKDWHGFYDKLELSKAYLAYCLRYLLAHTELSGDEELKKSVWSDESLADAYFTQGNKAYEKSEYSTAIVWHTYAMRIYKRSFKETNNYYVLQAKLSNALSNRGLVFESKGELELALSDYNLAIEIIKELRQQINKQIWPPEWQENLAMCYQNRGNVLLVQGKIAAAMGDYELAIELIEELRQNVVKEQHWHLELQYKLATLYTSMGLNKYMQGELAAALHYHAMTINLGEQLRQYMGEKDWPPEWQNDLAKAYMNHANTLQTQGKLASAVRDYGLAIDLREQLSQRMGEKHLSPEWQNELAAVYMNRGMALMSQGELAGAVRDYWVAIELREQLLFVQQFAPVIPKLATAFYNLLLLGQQEDLPAKFQPQQWHNQATAFLQRLEQMVKIEQLPEHWRREVERLRELLNKLF